MLSTLVDLIIYPIKKLLEMLMDERITSYLGVSVISIVVTCIITLIVIKALVVPSAAGSLAAREADQKVQHENRVKAAASRGRKGSGSKGGKGR